MTNTAFTFAPETDPQGYAGTALDIASAIEGAWKLSRYTESFVVISDHRDDAAGIPIARVGCEWLDSVAASGRDYDEELVEEPCLVRHTSCKYCGADVEVWLDDEELCARDRGGDSRCSLGTAGRHVPALDADDLAVWRDQMVG